METQLQHDRVVKVNWLTFNVPAMTLFFGIIVWGINSISDAAQSFERINARLDAIEESRALARLTIEKQLEPIVRMVNELPNVTYRVTTNEEALKQTNARVDRLADALGDLRSAIAQVNSDLSSGIAEVNTSVKVLTQRLESSINLRDPK